MKVSPECSNKIANLGMFCAFLVVCIHIPNSSANVSAQALSWYWARGVGKIAVPAFFAIAGFLLAGKFDEAGWWLREVRKRVKSLLIPLWFWSAAYYVIFSVGPQLTSSVVLGKWNLSNPSLETVARITALHPFSQPYLGVLWFVRVLFMLIMLAPCLRKIANPMGIGLLYVLSAIVHPDHGAACTPMVFTLQEGFFSVFAMTYFCLGIWMRERRLSMSVDKRIGFVSLVVGFGIIFWRGDPYADYWHRLSTWISIPFVLAGVWSLMPRIRLRAGTSGYSFVVYVLHMFVFGSIGIVLKKSGPMNHFMNETISGYILYAILGTIIPVLIGWTMKRMVPGFAREVFGGR